MTEHLNLFPNLNSQVQQVEKLVPEMAWLSTSYQLGTQCQKLSDDELNLPQGIVLYRIDEITYEDESPRQEALENVIASLRIPGINLIYLILGNAAKVNFYFGISPDNATLAAAETPPLNLEEIGRDVLQKSLLGNFRGSKISQVDQATLHEIMAYIANAPTPDHPKKLKFAVMEGVPGTTQDKEKRDFQGVDRLVDIMLGDEFGLLIVAKPLCNPQEIEQLSENLNEVYGQLQRFAKYQCQTGSNASDNTSFSRSTSTQEGTQEGKNFSEQSSKTMSWNNGISNSDSKGGGYTPSGGGNSTNHSNSTSDNAGNSVSFTTGTSQGESLSVSRSSTEQLSRQTGTQTGEAFNTSFELVDKKLQEWLKFFDDVLFPRLDCAMGRGLFVCSPLIFSPSQPVLDKLANVMKSIFSGEVGNRTPLHPIELSANSPRLQTLQAFQQPILDQRQELPHDKLLDQCRAATVHSKCLNFRGANCNDFYAGNWMSVVELGKIAGIPQKEVVGLRLREEVEFGLNVNNPQPEHQIILGKMLQSGNPTTFEVALDDQDLDRHLFVAGVTGSGKTTTCQNILQGAKCNFLVIEPAKTEYRVLLDQPGMEDLLIFTLGDDKVAPFRLNPLEFYPGESISSRVDMMMASISAAFDMDAAIPQLIEQAIYECYQAYGWNARNDTNRFYGEHAWDDGVYAFPTLNDVLKIMPQIIKKQGFDERLYDEYLGSIRARLGSLTVGAKGAMLNCKRSIDFEKLLDKKVILELENVRSGAEKSLIIGFILTNLLVAIKHRFKCQGGQKIRHITLVEEAHRLMSKFVPGDNPNKKYAVETFADMLAEIRKYGESMIIADQIPNKLTPDVLKNTNIKIVHRLFAQDDKDAIGSTMSLSNDQRQFLSNLELGHAIVFSGNWPKAVHVKVAKKTDTSKPLAIKDENLRIKVLEFYASCYQHGIFAGLEKMAQPPTVQDLENYIKYIQNSEGVEEIFSKEISMDNNRLSDDTPYLKTLRDMATHCGEEVRAAALTAIYLLPDKFDQRVDATKQYLKDRPDGKFPRKLRHLIETF